ncbi:uncharacterized protein NPIL_238201 [Nephila pilipes]|uniref:Uncharacterized protein n=1 Tax=Nephila pilipes TaxID=299642 RepID=A0A8X6PXG9_NEPPI|nr:uncharacterized protein NPIL_238201 [Nephila pilipes]
MPSVNPLIMQKLDANPKLLEVFEEVLNMNFWEILSKENNRLAWSLLEERYSNTREQIYADLKRFMNIPVVQNESASTIQNLIDVTIEVVRSLEYLDQNLEGFSSTIFAFILTQKLDQNSKIGYERNLKDTLPTISELLDFLKDYARTLNAAKTFIIQKFLQWLHV